MSRPLTAHVWGHVQFGGMFSSGACSVRGHVPFGALFAAFAHRLWVCQPILMIGGSGPSRLCRCATGRRICGRWICGRWICGRSCGWIRSCPRGRGWRGAGILRFWQRHRIGRERVEIGDHVGALLIVRQTSKGHRGARRKRARFNQPSVECGEIPGAIFRFQGGRIIKARRGGDLAPDYGGPIFGPWPSWKLWQAWHCLATSAPRSADALASKFSIGTGAGAAGAAAPCVGCSSLTATS